MAKNFRFLNRSEFEKARKARCHRASTKEVHAEVGSIEDSVSENTECTMEQGSQQGVEFENTTGVMYKFLEEKLKIE